MTEGNSKGRFLARGTAIIGLALMSFFFFGVRCSLAADAAPDLKGVWEGKVQVAGFGELGHTEHTVKPVFKTVELTIRITAQEGMVFSGFKESKKAKEEMLGLIKPDNKSIYMSDTDGYYIGTLISPDEMEIVYLEAGTKSRVASYAVYKRVK